jgi:hypothetical protein
VILLFYVEFADLIHGQQLALSIGQAIRDLELIARVYEAEDIRNRVEFIPL